MKYIGPIMAGGENVTLFGTAEVCVLVVSFKYELFATDYSLSFANLETRRLQPKFWS